LTDRSFLAGDGLGAGTVFAGVFALGGCERSGVSLAGVVVVFTLGGTDGFTGVVVLDFSAAFLALFTSGLGVTFTGLFALEVDEGFDGVFASGVVDGLAAFLSAGAAFGLVSPNKGIWAEDCDAAGLAVFG
jgi:hypothetical protein